MTSRAIRTPSATAYSEPISSREPTPARSASWFARGVAAALLIVSGAEWAQAEDPPPPIKPWVLSNPERLEPVPDPQNFPNRSRLLDGLRLRDEPVTGPPLRSRSQPSVERFATPRSAPPSRLTTREQHRATQYRSDLLRDLRRLEREASRTGNRRDFDRLQRTRSELSRVERELSRSR